MAAYKSLIALFAVLAVVASEQPPKDKRDVFVGAYPYAGAPIAYGAHPVYAAPAANAAAPAVAYAAPDAYAAAPAVPYAAPTKYYDDGKYYPGKYERPTVYPTPLVHYG